MGFLIFSGVVAFIFSVLFLFAPKSMHKLDKRANKTLVSLDEKIYNLRIGLGISLLLVAVLTLFVAYYLSR